MSPSLPRPLLEPGGSWWSFGVSVDTQAERALVSRDGLCSPFALCFGDGRESLRVSLVTLLWH